MASIVIGDYFYQTVELGQGKKMVRAFAEGSKTSYGEILSEVTIEGITYPVTSLDSCFAGKTALITAPAIPNSITNMRNAFSGCTSLAAAPVIPESVIIMGAAFSGCTALTGNIVINSTPSAYTGIFYNTQKGIWLTGASTNLSSLALTDNNKNVFVGEIPLNYSLDIERVAGDGGTVQDPEGLWAHIQLTINWADFTENSIDAITLKNGAATVSPTWYTDAAKTSSITLPNWRPSASTTIHCWLAITSATHVFSVTVEDRYHTGAVISFTVPQQFRTMDFLAGGQGVAFGMPATQAGMFINMALAIKQANGIINNIYDVFHPAGSYYETSDSTFDPNVVWGGTWVLETSGLVHVSGATNDANYPVDDTYTDANSGAGQQQGGDEDVTLTTDQIPAHTHGSSGGVTNGITGGSHHHTNYRNKNVASGSAVLVAAASSSSNGLATTNETHTHNLPNHTHSSVGKGEAHNNMQPYINVYRWHRTA